MATPNDNAVFVGSDRARVATLVTDVAHRLASSERDYARRVMRRYAPMGHRLLTDLVRRCVAGPDELVLSPNEVVCLVGLAHALQVHAGRSVLEGALDELVRVGRARWPAPPPEPEVGAVGGAGQTCAA